MPSRGGMAARGYGREHFRTRRQVAHVVRMGAATCARCGGAILPTDEWDLDHTDDRSAYLGPSHASCNRGKRPAGQRPARTSRDW